MTFQLKVWQSKAFLVHSGTFSLKIFRFYTPVRGNQIEGVGQRSLGQPYDCPCPFCCLGKMRISTCLPAYASLDTCHTQGWYPDLYLFTVLLVCKGESGSLQTVSPPATVEQREIGDMSDEVINISLPSSLSITVWFSDTLFLSSSSQIHMELWSSQIII